MRYDLPLLRGLLFLALCVQSAHGQSTSVELVPVPKSLEQGKIDRPLREKYKAEFASREPREQLDFARQLKKQADAENDTTAKFVLLREARDMAISGSDFPLVMSIIDDIAETYQIPTEEMKASALSLGMDKSTVPPAELAASYLKVADDALAIWNLDLAHKAAYMARKVSTGNRDMIAQADARDKAARLRNHDLVTVVNAEKKLAANPDDPQLNFTIGRHLCFNTDHWDNGLGYLAKSPPGQVKTLAQRDLANPMDAAEMAALGDSWWDLTDVKNSIPAGAGRRRAAYWYAKAAPKLTGDSRRRAEERIGQVHPPEK